MVPSRYPLYSAQSSTLTTRGLGAGSVGTSLTRRKSVSGLVGIVNFSATRAPGSLPRAKPNSQWASVWRSVVRACA